MSLLITEGLGPSHGTRDVIGRPTSSSWTMHQLRSPDIRTYYQDNCLLFRVHVAATSIVYLSALCRLSFSDEKSLILGRNVSALCERHLTTGRGEAARETTGISHGAFSSIRTDPPRQHHTEGQRCIQAPGSPSTFSWCQGSWTSSAVRSPPSQVLSTARRVPSVCHARAAQRQGRFT